MGAAGDVYASCFGRAGYASWSKAERAMRRGRFREKDGRGMIAPYRCRYCHSWHLGRSA